MSNRYLFQGVVLPERAELTHVISMEFSHLTSGVEGKAKISIIRNQVAVTIDSSHEWDIFDLRNVVVNLVRSQLDAIGYLRGYAYDLEISRVINHERCIDWVYGIDVPCIAGREMPTDLDSALKDLFRKLQGGRGALLRRSFSDLVSALKNADDTGFYCYRAIESLRHHCAATHGLSDAKKELQWDKFREVARVDRSLVDLITNAAKPGRHGEVVAISASERVDLLTATWRIVDSYIAQVHAEG